MSAAPRLAFVDGEPAAGGLLLDRGLHYGDGLFETVIVRDGRPRFLALHARRLADGCDRLGFPSCDAAALLASAAERIRTGDARAEGVLKLILTRGDAVARGYGTTGAERPRAIVLWYPGTVPAPDASPFTAVTLTCRWGENRDLAGLKHLNRLEQVLARRELAGRGADEGVVAGSGGHVCSGTAANLFLRVDGEWLTPRIDTCGIAGVVRAVVLREAPAADIAIREAEVPVAALARADAAFFTNARLGIRPATTLDGRALARDPGIESLAARIHALAD